MVKGKPQEQKKKKAQKDLQNAISCGNVRNVIKAHKNGADINLIDEDKFFTPIYVATMKRYFDVVKCLSDLGVTNVNTMTHTLYSALGIATMYGDFAIIQELVKLGADVNALQSDKKISPISLAISDIRIMKIFVEAGAQINPRDSSGATPLYRACQEGRLETVEYLTGLGADVDTYQDAAINPIGVSVLHNFTDIVLNLLKHGSNVNSVQYPGYSLIGVAVQNDNAEMIELLASHGADVNHIDFAGSTAAYTASSKGFIRSLRVLQKYGADFNILHEDADEVGIVRVRSCIYIAAGTGYLDIVNLLCENGADFTIKCTSKLADPMFIAAQEGKLDVIKALVGFGAYIDPSDTTVDCSPLFIAAKNGHLDVVKYLASQGASVHVKATHCEVTPMIAASFHGHIRMMKLLQSLGADIEHATKDAVSPLSLSNLTQNTKVQKYTQKLISKKASSCQGCQVSGTATGVKLKLCSACESVRYCCRKCQLDKYKAHKGECKRIRTERESGCFVTTLTDAV